VAPLEGERNRPVRTLDLGAGNGWLSYRLAERGHQVAAVDLLTDNRDGLGTHTLYPVGYTPIQAEFDRLPLDDGQADLAVFNASLHYSRDYEVTLSEALRVLRDEGTLVILDSPVYRQRRSGEKMIEERGRSFETRYGFRSGSPPGEGFLTFNRLDQLSNRLGVEWQTLKPFYGLGWTAKRWRELVFGSREPATFMLIVGGRR
jgi:SAM-dependent methyltransferase